MRQPTAIDVIQTLSLEPLSLEGGYFRQTWKSSTLAPFAGFRGERSLGTCIYYLVTADSPSKPHRVRQTEFFFFHSGDRCEMTQNQNEEVKKFVLGPDIFAHDLSAVKVEPQVWQSLHIKEKVLGWALFSVVCIPGFEFEDFELNV